MKVTNLITKKVLKSIEDINRKCHVMHLPSPPVHFFQMEVRDADGTLVELMKSKSNSWVRNAYNYLAQTFLPCSDYQGLSTFGAGSQSVKSTGGTTYRTAGSSLVNSFGTMAPIYNSSANANYGVLIGSGDTAESFGSHALAALIAHGTGSGQMSYAAGTEPTASYNADTKKWTGTMTRVFTNGSGAAVTVKEIGIVHNLVPSGGSQYPFLMSRDVLATPVTVGNGQTLTITYTSEITYPA